MHYYTYAYLREDKTPYYIGKGKGNRIYSTYRRIKPPKDKSRIIFLKKNLTEEKAFKHEIYMIAVLGRKDLGTGILHNRTDGGEGTSGCIPSEKTRRKLSERQKGEKNHNYGKTHSEEHKRKMSESAKGKTHSEESKKRMSDAQKGKTLSEEHRRKMSEANKGHIVSEETRIKISEALKNPSEEARTKIGAASKGRNKGMKWWNDGCENCKRMVECPGDGWKLGRK